MSDHPPADVADLLRRQAQDLIAAADRIIEAANRIAPDAPTPAEPAGPAPPVPSQGSVMVAAERLRSIQDKGFDAAHDRQYRGTELAWAAYTYLERAAQDRLDQDDPSIPHVWPLHRQRWRPKASRIRNLVVAANLVVSEIDRLLDAGEKP